MKENMGGGEREREKEGQGRQKGTKEKCVC